MDMPCPCQNCGTWFDLHDGHGSEKWFPNTVICEECYLIEEKEIENDNEIEEQINALNDAVWTINESLKELERLGAKQQVYIVRYCYQGAYENKLQERVFEYLRRMSGKLVLDPKVCLKNINSELADFNQKHPKLPPVSLYDFEQDIQLMFYPAFGTDRAARCPCLKLEHLKNFMPVRD